MTTPWSAHRVLRPLSIAGSRCPAGVARAVGESLPNQGVHAAFDGDISTAWKHFNVRDGRSWLEMRFSAPALVTAYSLTSSSGSGDPASWQLLGDGRVIAAVSDFVFPSRHYAQLFQVAIPGPYQVYRLQVSKIAPATADAVQLAELIFMCGVGMVHLPADLHWISRGDWVLTLLGGLMQSEQSRSRCRWGAQKIGVWGLEAPMLGIGEGKGSGKWAPVWGVGDFQINNGFSGDVDTELGMFNTAPQNWRGVSEKGLNGQDHSSGPQLFPEH